jgi:putative ABC transport system substrate-binding protein
MTRVLAMVMVVVVALAAPLATEAQPAGKVYRIGLLTTYYRPDDIGPVAFRQELRRLGWIEGENIVIEVRSAEGKAERLSELAADLVRLKVDVITAMGDLAAVPASQATRTIPIVAGSADPVGIGLVTNLARPEGNVTGLHIQAAETAGKRLQLLKEVVPTVSRVAVLWNATHRGKQVEFGETQVAAQALGVELQSVEVRTADDFDRAFLAISTGRPGALVTFTERLTIAHRRRIAEFAARNRLPMVAEIKEFADAGGLMTYGPSEAWLSGRAAYYVDRILRGAKPADLPVEQPTKFELIVNLKTARALGVTIPPAVLARADEVIQ